jgi:hypothetical protein
VFSRRNGVAAGVCRAVSADGREGERADHRRVDGRATAASAVEAAAHSMLAVSERVAAGTLHPRAMDDAGDVSELARLPAGGWVRIVRG